MGDVAPSVAGSDSVHDMDYKLTISSTESYTLSKTRVARIVLDE